MSTSDVDGAIPSMLAMGVVMLLALAAWLIEHGLILGLGLLAAGVFLASLAVISEPTK